MNFDENLKKYLTNKKTNKIEEQNYSKRDLKNNYKIGIKYYEEIENKINNK